MSIIKKWFNFDERQLTPTEKVQDAQGRVEGALSMFSLAVNEIDEANKTLQEALVEDQKNKEVLLAKVDNVDKNMGRANDEIAANNNLKERLKEFTK